MPFDLGRVQFQREHAGIGRLVQVQVNLKTCFGGHANEQPHRLAGPLVNCGAPRPRSRQRDRLREQCAMLGSGAAYDGRQQLGDDLEVD